MSRFSFVHIISQHLCKSNQTSNFGRDDFPPQTKCKIVGSQLSENNQQPLTDIWQVNLSLLFTSFFHSQNEYSYDAYNNNNIAYNGTIGGPNVIRLGDSLGLNSSQSLSGSVNIGPYRTSLDGHNAYPTYNGVVNGGTSVLDWPVQSDVYGTIGHKPAPLTLVVPKTVIEDQHQTVHVPRTVVDTATKTVSVPRTVMDKKSRMIQEPRTIYEQKDEEYKVPRTVIEQETRIIQVPRTVYDEQRITVNVPKTVYESHSRKVTVPKTVIHEREEYYEVPRQIIENKEVNYEVARTVYDTKTTVVQVRKASWQLIISPHGFKDILSHNFFIFDFRYHVQLWKQKLLNQNQ